MVSTIAAAAAAPAIPAAPRPSPARARGRASDDATSQPTPRKAADRALPATSLSTTRSWLVRRGVSEQQRCATEHGTARQARRRLWPVTARRDPSDADNRPKLVPLRQHSGAVRQQQAAEWRAECVGLRAAGGARRWMRSHLLDSAPRPASAWSQAAITIRVRARSLFMLVDVPRLRPSIRSVGILARDKSTLVATDHARAGDRMRARNRWQPTQAGRLNALERSQSACHGMRGGETSGRYARWPHSFSRSWPPRLRCKTHRGMCHLSNASAIVKAAAKRSDWSATSGGT